MANASKLSSVWSSVWRFAPLALFGAALVWVIAGPRCGPSAPELPAYTVTSAAPAGEAGPPRLRVGHGRDDRFEVSLRPAAPPASDVVAYVFTSTAEGSEPNAVDARVEVGRDGAVRISGASRALAGARDLRVVVGPPSAFAKFDDAAAHAKSGKGDASVQVVVLPVERE